MRKDIKILVLTILAVTILVSVMMVPVQAKVVIYQGTSSIPEELENIASDYFMFANLTLYMTNSTFDIELSGIPYRFETEKLDIYSKVYLDQNNTVGNGIINIEMCNTILVSEYITANIGYLTLDIYFNISDSQLDYELTKTVNMPLIIALLTEASC